MKKILLFILAFLFLYQIYNLVNDQYRWKDSEAVKEIKQRGIFEKMKLDNAIIERIEKYSCKKGFCTKKFEELRYLRMSYINFNGEEEIGEMICDERIADDLLSIFETLYQAKYPIERMKLIDDYMGDDTLSMRENNTSAFNFRYIASTKKLSNHSEGLAIDINPLYNPQVFENGSTAPKEGALYKDRSIKGEHMIDYDDLAYQLFTEHGFTWGGDFKQNKDYQHFEKKV